MKLTQNLFSRNIAITKFSVILPLLFLFLHISCKENSTESTDSGKPTVSFVFPFNGADIKADTVYLIIVNATDDKGIREVLFYIDDQWVKTDNTSPYEYWWSTDSLTGNHTIVAKGSRNTDGAVGTATINIQINGTTNDAPASPNNPWPANTAIGISTRPTLWSLPQLIDKKLSQCSI